MPAYPPRGVSPWDDLLKAYIEGLPIEDGPFKTNLSATYVRFVDQNGDPLPPGSLTTIHVNTTTGQIDDITFEEGA